MVFGDSKKKTARSTGTVETLIGQRVLIKGDVHFEGGLYIEGHIEGAVQAGDDAGAVLTLAEQGRIEGEVRAPVVIINGRLTGDVHASERVELGGNARIEGNIHYKMIEMAAGAAVTGRLIHSETPARLTGPEANAAATT